MLFFYSKVASNEKKQQQPTNKQKTPEKLFFKFIKVITTNSEYVVTI
jgi:hypothetical protein